MKVIITGSHTLTDYKLIQTAITESKFDVTRIITGNARGIEELAERWAKSKYIRYAIYYLQERGNDNEKMVEHADALIVIRDEKCEKTNSIIDIARKYGLKVYVKKVEKE